MNSDTPRTDAGCAPVYFNNGTSTIAADPEISRQLERELTAANEKIVRLEAYLAAAHTTNQRLIDENEVRKAGW